MKDLRVNRLKSDVFPAPAKSKNLPPTANKIMERSNLMIALFSRVGSQPYAIMQEGLSEKQKP